MKILFTPNPQPGDYWRYMGRRCRIRGIVGKNILNACVYVDFLDDMSFRGNDWLAFKLFGCPVKQ